MTVSAVATRSSTVRMKRNTPTAPMMPA